MVTLPTSEIGEIEVVGSAYEAANGADVLIVLTEWQEFADLDFNLINETMRRPVIVDARNLLDPHYLEPLGFLYIGIGQ